MRANFDWAYDATTSDFQARLLFDGVVVRNRRQEPKESGGNNGTNGTDNEHNNHWLRVVTVAAASTADAVLEWRATANGVESSLGPTLIYAERIS